ncbi:MAG: PD-(D/E)XK nuclease family transposase, partial [Paludibacteraceae bacterium]|nr:PD-(D/E)XK nuclease family transposase [Paludibacteraceae bacterium]
DENRVFTDNLNFVFLEMPKFNKKEDELHTFLDKWLFVLKNLYKLKEQPQALTEGIFRKLFEVAEIASFSANERSNYEESLKNFWDLNNCLDSAERKGFEKGEASGMKKGKEEGLAEGFEKGEAIGLEKGEAIGLVKGKEEGLAEGLEKGAHQEKIDNAKKMKSRGFSVEDIAEITGLSAEEIEKL